jgi:hypothetical protein
MPSVKVHWIGVNEREADRAIRVLREPGDWSCDEAQAFLHALQRGTGTPRCPFLHTVAIRLRHVERGCVVVEIVTNAGAVQTEPLGTSPLALAWLEEARFEMPAG